MKHYLNLLHLRMQYSKERIDFLNGDTHYEYAIEQIGNTDEYELYIDVTKKYRTGDERRYRYKCDELIIDLYYLKRYFIDTTKSFYKKYLIAVDAKLLIQNHIAEFEREIVHSKLNVRRYDYSFTKEELLAVIEGYKVVYENVWWKAKAPIMIAFMAMAFTGLTYLDRLGIFPEKIKEQPKIQQEESKKPKKGFQIPVK